LFKTARIPEDKWASYTFSLQKNDIEVEDLVDIREVKGGTSRYWLLLLTQITYFLQELLLGIVGISSLGHAKRLIGAAVAAASSVSTQQVPPAAKRKRRGEQVRNVSGLPCWQQRFLTDAKSYAALSPVSARMRDHADVMLGHSNEAAGFCCDIVAATMM
jgi:hypothetical protein